MLDISKLEKIDTDKMYKIYEEWPKIALKSFELEYSPINLDEVKHIVFAGMGGSGAIGDMFSSILSKTKIHVNVVKGYLLPYTVDADTLVIVVSVSGNTAEALSILDSACKIGSKIIVFSSGGKMEEFCKKNNIEHKMVPKYHSPRASFTSYLYTILNVLHKTLEIEQNDIIESIKELENIKKKIDSLNLTDNNPAIELAKWIKGIPMVYYPFGLQSAAIRFKNSIQENAKLHTATEDVIEFCHNGIVAWEIPSKHQPILLQGTEDNIKTKEKYEVLKEFFRAKNIDYKEVTSVNGNIISKIVSLIYLLDYTSIYKAVMLGIDPSPVKSIEFIKSKSKN